MLGAVVLHRFHPFCASSALYVTRSSCSKGSVKISVINTSISILFCSEQTGLVLGI